MKLRWNVAIFIAAFAFYLLSSGREPAWGDANGMWDIANSVLDGRIDTRVKWPEDIPAGADGKFYGIAPIGTSLAHVPGAAVAKLGHAISPRHDALVRPLAVHLGPALLGALACLVFFGLLGDLGIRPRTASLCTIILACATTQWVYARMPYSEILQLACFLGLFRAVLRVAEAPVRREALWLGVWAGCLVNAKYVFATAIVGGLVVIAWILRKRRAELVTVAKWAAVTGVPLAIVALAYNDARWGSVAKTGYEPYLDAYFGGSLFDGAWGMLLSPNKSVFEYSPPLILAALAMPAAIRKVPRYGLAVLAMVVPVFLVYCTYRSWSGEYAWGPRFFVWAVPVLLVPIAWWIDAAVTRWRRGVLVAVVAAGVIVQLLGSALYWDHFIRVAIEAKNQWLGQPNRRGSYIDAKNRGHCDSCFEDTYELLWTPAFHPIRGHWWLIKSIARDDTQVSAQADAPWRHYTTLDLNLSSYPRARIDWWGLLWMKDATHTWVLGLVVLVLLTGGLAAGVWMWLRLHRSS
ncbi:MAG: hypothetical protein ABI867_28640 [Kofleriaceae bacterium]